LIFQAVTAILFAVIALLIASRRCWGELFFVV